MADQPDGSAHRARVQSGGTYAKDEVPNLNRAVEFGENAKRQLRLFAPSQEREALMGLADYVLLRDR